MRVVRMTGGKGSGASPYLIAIAGVGLAVFALRAAINPYMVDDALITFQYVRSAVDHGVLVWHQSLPPVDGYTSLGHVLLLWGGVAAGLDIVLANTLIATTSMALIAVLFLRYATTARLPVAATAVGLFVICINAGFVYWFSAGLETILYAAIFFLVYVRYEAAFSVGRLSFGDAAALITLGLVRPEGCFIALALILFFVIISTAREHALQPSVAPAALATLTILAIFAWRTWVYGHPLPNTYYAKASASQSLEVQAGLLYAINWVVYFGGALTVLTVLNLVMEPRNFLRFLFVFGQIALVILEGGDPHPEMRFLLPVIPLVAIDLSIMLARPQLARRAIAVLLMLIYVPLQVPPKGVVRPSISLQRLYAPEIPDFRKGYENIMTGAWPFVSFAANTALSEQVGREPAEQLGVLLKPDARVGGADVGALAYFSGLPVLDANGLNHRRIGNLAKPAGTWNIWGLTNFEQVMNDDPEAIYISFPRYSRWTWAQFGAEADNCDNLERHQFRLIRSQKDRMAREFACVSAPAAHKAGYFLNFLVNRERMNAALAVAPGGLEISDCLANVLASCPSR